MVLLGITNDNEVTWPDRSDIDNDDGRRMLESSHTHFVVVKGTHPDRKIDTIDTIVESFAQKVPVLVVLVNDSPLAKDGILRSVRRGWPILIIEGSGGLADEIHHVWQKKQDDLKKLSEWDSSKTVASKTVLSFIEDPVIAEVIAKGDLQFFSITDTSEKLERRINSRLRSQSVLEGAVQLQRTYSLNANQYQKVSGRIQNTILMLGVLITSLTVFQYSYKQILGNIQLTASSFNGNLEAVLHFAILIMPIVLAVLIEGSKRSNTANKWILMRTISESIKQEVFRYRTRTGVYSDIQLIKRETTREISLASRLESITNQLAESNPDADTPPPIAKDRSITGVSQRHSSFRLRRSQTGSRLSEYLSADSYVLQRLENQIAFYKNRITKLERRWSRFQWYILGLGGFATLLTTLHFDPAVAITTAFSTALVTYLESNQVASTLRSYNNATLKLSNIRAWWIALKDAQADQENIDKLVDDTEAVLHLEMERNPLQIQKENK